MTQRDTTADQLIKVIQVLQLGRKTGILTVERGEGSTFEEGMLVFADGLIIGAKIGYRNGMDACNLLYTWTQCRFAFIPQSPTQDTPSSRSYPHKSDLDVPPPPDTRPTVLTPSPNQKQERTPRMPTHTEVPYQKKLLPGRSVQLIETARLSRAHKHLFMLVNGERTLTDLARLTGRQVQEVATQLNDLEKIGVIHREPH
ncbi:DUF4388 domain-containing protein [Dictyobacter alpinus]|uniref:DUF4388 domain-containing protein n=1 Tax=Dictyobacter alpinus TaxID=2014873 RepID=UPI0013873871|nr:DUF4388 domain-containing protein [Dictyobacter alpinus]